MSATALAAVLSRWRDCGVLPSRMLGALEHRRHAQAGPQIRQASSHGLAGWGTHHEPRRRHPSLPSLPHPANPPPRVSSSLSTLPTATVSRRPDWNSSVSSPTGR